MSSLDTYWYKPTPLSWLLLLLLLPLSWLYCAVSSIRRKLYLSGVLESVKADVPVVVIGNIVAGGSGKTPLLIAICEYVKKKGFKPGVVSRGYGGSFTGVKQLVDSDTAELVGDEPLMIYRRTGVPVVVSADRASAVEALLADNDCDVVFSDDGMQHYRMARDMEIAVVDAGRRFGNGLCLPAGPLRERVKRLDDVDLVVYNGGSDNLASYTLRALNLNKLDSDSERSLADFKATLEPSTRLHAVAGIGNPSRFFDQLRASGLDIDEYAFTDHHQYQTTDFEGWEQDCIIMTEKDAVKCAQLALTDAWYLEVEAAFSKTLETELASRLLPLLEQR
jgi:tetraacyldisaccharide 4'-kinase